MICCLEQRYHVLLQVMTDRLRTILLRLRGAHLGARCRIGSDCVFQRPWCLATGERTQFEHGVFVKATNDLASIRLGREVFVGCSSEFDISDSLWIGDKVLIAPGCFITDHNHLHAPGRFIADQGCESAPVRLEDDVWLGAHVVVLPGVTLGHGAIAAAGAVVCSDVAPMTIVAGVPARVIGTRRLKNG